MERPIKIIASPAGYCLAEGELIQRARDKCVFMPPKTMPATVDVIGKQGLYPSSQSRNLGCPAIRGIHGRCCHPAEAIS
jgi:hypothetical protein